MSGSASRVQIECLVDHPLSGEWKRRKTRETNYQIALIYARKIGKNEIIPITPIYEKWLWKRTICAHARTPWMYGASPTSQTALFVSAISPHPSNFVPDLSIACRGQMFHFFWLQHLHSISIFFNPYMCVLRSWRLRFLVTKPRGG